jgi:hypothetical protein
MSTGQAGFLQQRGANPLPPTQGGEEKAPDRGTAEESNPATPVTAFSIPANPLVPPLFGFFVDGVQRTVPIAEVSINGIRVPIHMAHVAAGAMLREDRELRPILIQQAMVLLLPYQALAGAMPVEWGQLAPPGRALSAAGDIYGAVRSTSFGDEFYSDTSVNLRQQGEVSLTPGDLVLTGRIRSSALNRATELMRILELGVIWDLRQQYPDKWILLDGPIAPLTKYARLAAPALQGLQGIANPPEAFDFLRRVVGAVKEVTVVPSSGLEQALQLTPDLVTIPVFRFGEVVQQQEEIAKEVLSAYVWLRRELAAELSPIWSAVSGLARFDVALPAVLPDDPNTRNTWNTLEDEQIAALVQPSELSGQRLRQILEQIILERWPVPPSTPMRVFVELYPIAETELWLMASLYDAMEIRARGIA